MNRRLIVIPLALALFGSTAWADKPDAEFERKVMEGAERTVLDRALERYKHHNPKEVREAVEAFQAIAPVVVPSWYAGEMPNERDAYVPHEFYVGGLDLNTSTDFLFQDLKSLTPNLARCIPTPEPENGIVIRPVPGAVGVVQCKAIFGNQFGSFERLISVGVLPAGSVTMYPRRITFDFHDVYE